MPNNHHTLNASVPIHLYGHVCKEILYGLDKKKVGQFEDCVVLGVTSIPSRALHWSVMCNSGAQWARIPLHMIRWTKPDDKFTKSPHELSDLQCWDSHGWNFSVTLYDYLTEMTCVYRSPSGKKIPARYWFTLDHTDNGYSQYPAEHKCYHILLLEDGSGQVAAMPNNRILWQDKSFVTGGHKLDYKTMHPTTWHAENTARVNPQDTAMTKDVEPKRTRKARRARRLTR